jgi:hypothetical protein
LGKIVDEWSIVEQILAPLVGAGLLFAFTQYFRHRRLCLVTNYYPRSELSATGKAVAFTILNRGHRSEKTIQIELDPARSYTLLAATTEAISLNSNILRIDHMHARDDVSVIVEVDGGDFDNNRIVRFGSSETAGKVFNKLNDVPLTPGVVPGAVMLGLLMLGGPGFLIGNIICEQECTKYKIETIQSFKSPFELSKEQEERVNALEKIGWSNTDDFVRSELDQFYPIGEYPVTVSDVRRAGEFVGLRIEISNKGSDWLSITAEANTTKPPPQGSCEAQVVDDYINDLIVPAHSKAAHNMIVYMPETENFDDQIVRLNVHLSYGADFITNQHRFVDLSGAPDLKSESEPKSCNAGVDGERN